MIRFDINEARKKTKQRNNYFLRNTLLDITQVSFSLYLYFFLWTFSDPFSMMIFLPIYSYLDCIPTFHFEDCGSFFWYLSHHCLASSGRVDYRLWRHCLGVILPLMWCGRVSCKTFNAEVVDAGSGSFLSLLPVHHHGPPRPFKLSFFGPLPISQGAVIPCTPQTGRNPQPFKLIFFILNLRKKKCYIHDTFTTNPKR